MFRKIRFLLDGGAGSPDAGDPGGSGAPGEPGEGAGGGNEPQLPDTVEGYKELLGKTLTDHKSEVEKYKTAEEKLKHKLGSQGTELGSLRKVQERIDADTEGFIRELAEQKKLKVNFGEAGALTAADILAQREAGDIDFKKAGELLEGLIDTKVKAGQHQSMTASERARMLDHLGSKYKDWNDLEADRGALGAEVAAMAMTHHELLHLAVQGRNLPDILKAHREEVRQEVIDEIHEKVKSGQPAGAGEGSNQSGKGGDAEAPTAKKMIERMHEQMGR